MPPEVQRRYFDAKQCKIEMRADSSGSKKLRGYAAVFNSMSEDLGWYREMIMPGAFTSALRRSDLDTVALFNHNPDLVLARYPNTLRMSQDSQGLECEMDLIDTQVARDVQANIEAGNVYQMSFAFTVARAHWNVQENGDPGTFDASPFDDDDEDDVRYVDEVGLLIDVSPVTYPAYTATSISAASKDERRQLKKTLRDLDELTSRTGDGDLASRTGDGDLARHIMRARWLRLSQAAE